MKVGFMADSEVNLHRLEYGRAEPNAARVIRNIPLPSIWSILLLVLAGFLHLWFWNDHEPWVLQSSFEYASPSLEGALNPARTQLLIGSGQGASRGIIAPFHICEIATQKTISTFGFPNEWADNSFFSADGSRVITIGGTVITAHSGNSSRSTFPNDVVHLWNAATGTLVAQFGPLGQVNSNSGNPVQARFSPDGGRVVTVENNRAMLYDAATGRHIADLENHTESTGFAYLTDTIFFSPDGQKAVIKTYGGPVHFYAMSDGHLISERWLEHGSPNGIEGAFSPDSTTFACGDYGWIYQLDPNTGHDVLPPIKIAGMVKALWFSADSSRLLTDTTPTPGDLLTSYSRKPNGGVPATRQMKPGMAWWLEPVPHSNNICVYSYDQSIQMLDAANLSLIQKIPRRTNTREYPNSASPGFFSPEGSRMLTIPQNQGGIEILSPVTCQRTSSIEDQWHGISGSFCDAVFLGDSSHILTDTQKGIARVWKLRRAENGLGIISLPQFWLMLMTTLILLGSFTRDLRRFAFR